MGPGGVRVVCLLADMLPQAGKLGPHSRATFQPVAEPLGLTLDESFAAPAGRSLLQRWPTVADVAEAAAFVASDRARRHHGTVVNLTGGSLVD